MIKKTLEGRTPTGVNAIKAMETLERVTKVSHLRLNEFRVEGDLFIPRPWRMRGYVLCPNITNQGTEGRNFRTCPGVPLVFLDVPRVQIELNESEQN